MVTTSFSKKKVLTTEKVTTSDDVQKRTEKIKKVRRLLNVMMRFTNVLRRLKSEEVNKGSEKLEDMKEAMVTIRTKDPYNFEGQSKGSTGWLNVDHEFIEIKLSALEPDLYKKFKQDFLRPGLNMYNQLLSPQLMGFLRPKDI